MEPFPVSRRLRKVFPLLVAAPITSPSHGNSRLWSTQQIASLIGTLAWRNDSTRWSITFAYVFVKSQFLLPQTRWKNLYHGANSHNLLSSRKSNGQLAAYFLRYGFEREWRKPSVRNVDGLDRPSIWTSRWSAHCSPDEHCSWRRQHDCNLCGHGHANAHSLTLHFRQLN